MGERAWMGWLEGPIHHHLQIVEKSIKIRRLSIRCNRRLGTHQRQRTVLLRRSNPGTKQIRRPVQKILQHRIRCIGSRKRCQSCR